MRRCTNLVETEICASSHLEIGVYEGTYSFLCTDAQTRRCTPGEYLASLRLNQVNASTDPNSVGIVPSSEFAPLMKEESVRHRRIKVELIRERHTKAKRSEIEQCDLCRNCAPEGVHICQAEETQA